jgi:hypothetical protein
VILELFAQLRKPDRFIGHDMRLAIQIGAYDRQDIGFLVLSTVDGTDGATALDKR